jgi:hypothetical protein
MRNHKPIAGFDFYNALIKRDLLITARRKRKEAVMWKLWNWLFGWDYVHIGIGGTFFIRPICFDGDNIPYVSLAGEHIILSETEREWYPLTCPRSKYDPLFPFPKESVGCVSKNNMSEGQVVSFN